MARNLDALLDAYGRLWRALGVLHYEADTDLDFDAWVETTELRYERHVKDLGETTDEV